MRNTHLTDSRWPNEYDRKICTWPKRSHQQTLTIGTWPKIEVCVPELVLNETRQDETGPHFPNWRYRDESTFFGPITWENLGKIREINRTRRDFSIPLGKFSNSTEFWDFSRKTSINSTTQDFSWSVPFILYISVSIRYHSRIRTDRKDRKGQFFLFWSLWVSLPN